jgi:hypothetical protein
MLCKILGFHGMPSSGMWRRVALLRTDVSEDGIASINRVRRIDELDTMFAVTGIQSKLRVVPSSPILVTMMMKAMRSSETSALANVTTRNIPCLSYQLGLSSELSQRSTNHLRRWALRFTGLLDFVHRPVFKKLEYDVSVTGAVSVLE